jgi:hypothetical protein
VRPERLARANSVGSHGNVPNWIAIRVCDFSGYHRRCLHVKNQVRFVLEDCHCGAFSSREDEPGAFDCHHVSPPFKILNSKSPVSIGNSCMLTTIRPTYTDKLDINFLGRLSIWLLHHSALERESFRLLLLSTNLPGASGHSYNEYRDEQKTTIHGRLP